MSLYGYKDATKTAIQPSYVSPANSNYNRDSFMDYQQQFQPATPQLPSVTTPSVNGGGLFGMDQSGMDSMLGNIGSGVNIAGGLYGMYQSNQMMDLAKQDMGLRRYALNENIANRNRFVGDTKQAFA